MTTTQAPDSPWGEPPPLRGSSLAWDSDQLVVTDPDQRKKLNRPRLSASTPKAIGLALRRTTQRHRYAAARWANLRDPDAIAGRARNLQQALRDGINVRHILTGAAQGAHLRDSSGYWYDRRDPEVTRLADLD